MAACGYDEAVIARAFCSGAVRYAVAQLTAEAQTLEDVACLVFLRYYAENFAAGRRPREGVRASSSRTQRKMSPRGRAVGVDFGFPRADLRTAYSRGCGRSKPHRPLERLWFRRFCGERSKGESERRAWGKA